MVEVKTDFCKIEFYNRYVIVTFNENIFVNLPKAQEVRNKFREYYGNKDFVLITNRKYQHQVAEEVYEQGQLKNMKGLAIVSDKRTERDKAMSEQKLFDKSFVFFNTLEEAISWADTYFIN